LSQEHRSALSHVLWIEGATDSGKTTVSQLIAERRGLQSYHYDQHDLPQMERLAETLPRYRAFLDAPLDERWVYPRPEELLRRALQAFRDRFPLVIEELLALPRAPMVIAERFGLTLTLVAPLLSSNHADGGVQAGLDGPPRQAFIPGSSRRSAQSDREPVYTRHAAG
jgi:hypothetical protein